MDTSPVELMLKGYGLTTAEMIYRMPDHMHVLNTFVWQEYDLAPDYPRLFDFIEFWQASIDGPLHCVRFTHRKQLRAGEWRHVVGEFRVGEFPTRRQRIT
ncbi:usg protein [Roseinatronobacter sp. NSM]|uniref:usg protein n=1 Tax=Roseinatronobacter sp. NSM TaxID=3457785 RepID=UPI00403573E8